MDISPEGSQYVQRYHVYEFPHIAILDPRTGRLMWKKEGWTQENPVTAETFAEMAMDFCSRNSFDKPPQAPRPPGAKAPPPQKRPVHELSEDEQLQAAMRASMEDVTATDEKSDEDEVECLGTKEEMEEDTKPPAAPSFVDELLKVTVPDEPAKGARTQLRMPDGKRVVRKFTPSDPVKMIYAFLAVRAKRFVSTSIMALSLTLQYNVILTAIKRRSQGGTRVHAHGGVPSKGFVARHGQND